MYNFELSKKVMEKANKIGIFTHANADGDAIGSAFALYYYLMGLGKSVEVVAETTIPNQLKFLHIEDGLKQTPSFDYDLVIATDCNTADMMGSNKQEFLRTINSISFDHHPNNPEFAKINNLATDVSSASEIVAEFFIQNNIEITDKIAELLLSGIITDSGGFKFSCTTSNTMRVASELLKRSNINISSIMNNLFESETRGSFEMQKYAMNHTEFLFDGKVVLIAIDYNFYKSTGIDPNSCKFLTRIGTELKDTCLTALISEVAPNVNKVSFRSRYGYSASNCAKAFGGGGHPQASGCKIFGKFDETLNRIKKVLKEELECRG